MENGRQTIWRAINPSDSIYLTQNGYRRKEEGSNEGKEGRKEDGEQEKERYN